MMMLTGALMWGAAANAQTDFILRGGFATNTFVGSDYDNVDVMPGYNVGLDFNSYIKDGLYWNTGVMFGSRGFKVDYKKADDFEYRAHNIQIPLTVGYKFDMGSGFALDDVSVASSAQIWPESLEISKLQTWMITNGVMADCSSELVYGIRT